MIGAEAKGLLERRERCGQARDPSGRVEEAAAGAGLRQQGISISSPVTKSISVAGLDVDVSGWSAMQRKALGALATLVGKHNSTLPLSAPAAITLVHPGAATVSGARTNTPQAASSKQTREPVPRPPRHSLPADPSTLKPTPIGSLPTRPTHLATSPACPPARLACGVCSAPRGCRPSNGRALL
ncbi:hypothetical protein BCR44DRAFT_32384 [Catenaria anguillulae PL171]|uniref:Uncharacterized protein n=1 Tax=Catenaria anguillulae PL171 TaxID=765915 RepID=A0A1Y2H9X6_9FUNG|nr:hypothetical protein BCR44DRAFT_32384 [Catenaria anguillulae PL171]